jgi:hypothetical protein
MFRFDGKVLKFMLEMNQGLRYTSTIKFARHAKEA